MMTASVWNAAFTASIRVAWYLSFGGDTLERHFLFFPVSSEAKARQSAKRDNKRISKPRKPVKFVSSSLFSDGITLSKSGALVSRVQNKVSPHGMTNPLTPMVTVSEARKRFKESVSM